MKKSTIQILEIFRIKDYAKDSDCLGVQSIILEDGIRKNKFKMITIKKNIKKIRELAKQYTNSEFDKTKVYNTKNATNFNFVYEFGSNTDSDIVQSIIESLKRELKRKYIVENKEKSIDAK